MENISPNLRLTEFQAALLLVQMSRADEQMERRIRTHDFLFERLQGRGYLRTLAPDAPESTRRSHHGMLLRFIAEEWDGVDKDMFLKAMNAEGILIGGGYGFPLYREPALTDRRKLPPGDFPDYGSMFLPAAEKLSREGVLLPQQSLLAPPEEALDVVRAVDKIWENRDELRTFAK
jgi:dTDP-4-amino-4,6-dideoxygalactose transaminase